MITLLSVACGNHGGGQSLHFDGLSEPSGFIFFSEGASTWISNQGFGSSVQSAGANNQNQTQSHSPLSLTSPARAVFFEPVELTGSCDNTGQDVVIWGSFLAEKETVPCMGGHFQHVVTPKPVFGSQRVVISQKDNHAMARTLHAEIFFDTQDQAKTGCQNQEIFLSPTGVDQGQCDQNAPCKTLQYAFGVVSVPNRDEIFLADGIYTESQSLTLPKQICIQGESRKGVVIRSLSQDEIFHVSGVDQTDGQESTSQEHAHILLHTLTLDGRNKKTEYGINSLNIGGVRLQDIDLKDFEWSAILNQNNAGTHVQKSASANEFRLENFWVSNSSKFQGYNRGAVWTVGRYKDLVIRRGRVDYPEGFGIKFNGRNFQGEQITNVALEDFLIEDVEFQTGHDPKNYNVIALEFFRIATNNGHVIRNFFDQKLSLAFNNLEPGSGYANHALPSGYSFYISENLFLNKQSMSIEAVASHFIVDCNVFDVTGGQGVTRLFNFTLHESGTPVHWSKNNRISHNIVHTDKANLTIFESKARLDRLEFSNNLFLAQGGFRLLSHHSGYQSNASLGKSVQVNDNVFSMDQDYPSGPNLLFETPYPVGQISILNNKHRNFPNFGFLGSGNQTLSQQAKVIEEEGIRPENYYQLRPELGQIGPECRWSSRFSY
ncbi:MAG: hypothetical protein R3A11_07395 [Bdellovibrionota bacterium]